jgi:hypothetical protein
MTPDQDPFGYFALKSGIGSLFLCFAQVERSLKAEITARSLEPPWGLKAQITAWAALDAATPGTHSEHDALVRIWTDALLAALDVRNRIAHGLIGISGRDESRGLPARLTTILDGSARDITAGELDQVCRSLDRAVHVIPMLAGAIASGKTRWDLTYLAIRTDLKPPVSSAG